MTAVDRAYAYTKERILDGRFTAGLLISEGDVSADVGMSRTPVREAFLRLASEGLLQLYPKRGALVVPVSAAEVESVMETRLLVERFAIERVIASDADVASLLDGSIARQQHLADYGDPREFVETDREFHRIFVAASGNFILLQLHDSLRDRQSRMNVTALARDSDRMRQVLAEHRALVGAVNARDRDTAVAIIQDHLHQTLLLLRQASAALDGL